jgi:hypothetical protein
MSGGAGRSAGRRRLSPLRTGPGAGVLSGPRRSGKWGHSSLTTRGRIRPNLAPVRPSPHRCLSTDRAASRQLIRSDGWSRSCRRRVAARARHRSERHSGSRDRRGLVGHTGRFRSGGVCPRGGERLDARVRCEPGARARPTGGRPHRRTGCCRAAIGLLSVTKGFKNHASQHANTARTPEWVCVCICGRH